MLARAARNAYSWWWASHIRTKQSKWLDQNLLDMEEKVEYILKIITEDGDSFRVRAEQYYQKRHEVVNFVEDTFRGYRALAERYDHLSRDLQSANRTIAMVFPERVQMSFEEEAYEEFASNVDEDENMVPANSHVPLPPKQNNLPNMGSVVQTMLKKKSKMPTKMMCKKGLVKIGVDENASRVSKSSGLSKDEALEKIDELQKDILGFQTEKEFVKSSYENALSKYWEIEKNINEMHIKISNLQHEFAVGEAMDDQDAQTRMSASALKMCKETLDKLKHKQKRLKTEAVVEHHRVIDIKKEFEALIARDNNNINLKNMEQSTEHVKDKKAEIEEKESTSLGENGEEHLHDPNMQKEDDQQSLVERQPAIKFDKQDEYIEDKKIITKEEILETMKEITISEVAEKIEQLVDKVLTSETDLASQTALVLKLRFDIDDFHEQLQSLEQENNNLVETNNKNINIKKLEEELERVQMLDKRIKDHNAQLETSFDEASVRLDNLSNDLLIAKPDKDIKEDDVVFQSEKENTHRSPRLEEKERERQRKDGDDLEGFVMKPNEKDEGEEAEHLAFNESQVIIKDQDVDCIGEHDEPKLNLMFSHVIEDGDDMLVEEFTSTLKNLKEIKQKLNETENRNRARSFKTAVQMKMLRNSNDSKDAEIRTLYEKIKQLETKLENWSERKKLDKITKNELIKNDSDMVDEEAQDLIPEYTEEELELEETTNIELTKASNAIDEGTHRIEELVETAHFELQKARELINGGTQSTKKPDETKECQPMKSTDLVDEGTQRSKEHDETTGFDLKKPSKEVDEIANHESKKTPDLIEEGTQRTKEHAEGVDEGHEMLEVEEEVRAEIDNLRKENLELWLRFSTAYHQINRFQDSFHDLLQEIKQVKEKKPEHGSGKQRHNHHHLLYANDIRPLYRHLRDMQTEIILWLEKSGILEDDLQHRLTSLSDIQNELSGLNSNVISESETTTTNVHLNNYQAATFQGEVLNMKQENVKVLNELREATERVRMLQTDIDKTLSKLEEEIGQINKSNTSSKVPFRSILFGSKLRKKRKHSLFTCMSPSLQRQYSNMQELPQPREDS
ncbi:hypothetical protein R6Q59_036490 [Mikania micrantha]